MEPRAILYNIPQHVHKLTQDYEQFFKNGHLADVVLVAGGRELKAHKAILSARSKVFAAMFEHSETKEAQESRIEITDLAADVCQQLLRYIYSSNIDSLDHLAGELLAAADKVYR